MTIEKIIEILRNPMEYTAGEFHEARMNAAELLDQIKKGEKDGNTEWKERHTT